MAAETDEAPAPTPGRALDIIAREVEAQGWKFTKGETLIFTKALILGFSLGRAQPSALDAEDHLRFITRAIFRPGVPDVPFEPSDRTAC